MNNYIFCTNVEIEKQRLDILNNICNPNTMAILTQHIKHGSSILEIGFGEGQISDYLNTLEDIKYLGIDSDLGRVAKRYQENKYIFGDIMALDNIKALKRKKFDVIYARWILAYLPQYELKDIIKQLSGYLKRNGVLILEECDLYKSYIEKDETRVTIPIFEKWIDLSRFVHTMLNTCNFKMGSDLPEILRDIFKKDPIIYKYQPMLKGSDKKVITLGMKSSSCSLIEKKILNKEEIDNLICELEYAIIDKDNINVHYIETTTCVIQK